jgi:hypothetical protein
MGLKAKIGVGFPFCPELFQMATIPCRLDSSALKPSKIFIG